MEQLFLLVNNKPSMLRPEHKSIHFLQTLVEKFKNSGNTALELFAGSYSTARAWMLLPLNRRCFVSDSDPCFNKYGLQPLFEVFYIQVLNYNSYITGSDEVKDSSVSFIQALDVMRCRKHQSF